MFFEMEIHQDVDLVLEGHLQRPVAPGQQGDKTGQCIGYGQCQFGIGPMFFLSGCPGAGHTQIIRIIM
jgi:hypothetical protein